MQEQIEKEQTKKVLSVGDKYLVLIEETAFFKNEWGTYTPAKTQKRIEIREKKAPVVKMSSKNEL